MTVRSRRASRTARASLRLAPGRPDRLDVVPDPAIGAATTAAGRGARRPVAHPIAERLQDAREVSARADEKAGTLFTAAGVLAAAGAFLVDAAPDSPLVLGLGGVAGVALAGALLLLLAVITPRGGPAGTWLLPGGPAADKQLQRVAAIVELKHRLLRRATLLLAVVIVTGLPVVALTVVAS